VRLALKVVVQYDCPVSEAGNVGEPRLKSYARRSVCLCNQNGGVASIGLLT